MPYRINKRKRRVEVTGEADLDAIVKKVTAAGGSGWVVTASIPLEVFREAIERAMASQAPTPRPIGFRVVSDDTDHGLVTGLPFTPPATEDE